jgi:hypothetical protein
MKTRPSRGKNIAPHQDKRDCHANEIGKYHRNRQCEPLAETDPGQNVGGGGEPTGGQESYELSGMRSCVHGHRQCSGPAPNGIACPLRSGGVRIDAEKAAPPEVGLARFVLYIGIIEGIDPVRARMFVREDLSKDSTNVAYDR